MQRNSAKKLRLLLLFTLIFTSPAFAAPNIEIENKIEQQQVRVINGKEQILYLPAETTTPSSHLRFTVSYRNSGDEAAKDVVLNNPIPIETTYINGSATNDKGIEAEFSIDGGKNYKKQSLLTYEITLPNGSREKRVASPEEYTHVRWKIPSIPAGAAGAVNFEALVK